MSITWKDTTGYSQGDKERVPTTWSASVGDLRVTVTCSHIYYKGEWIARCEPFFSEYPLKVSTVEEAKSKALSMLREHVSKVVAAIDEGLDEGHGK